MWEEVPKKWHKYRDNFRRPEKGVDIQLVCDTLLLALNGKASNFVFFLNDRDYLPFFEALHGLGANIYITELSEKNPPQESLRDLSDLYLTLDDELDFIFGITKKEKQSIPLQSL